MIDTKALAAVGIMAAVTYLIRSLPFLVLGGRKIPRPVTFLGKYLPYAIMGMLVIYCLKDIHPISGLAAMGDGLAAGNRNISLGGTGIAELLAILCIILLHVWKRNTLLSIVGGTACYMILIRIVIL